MAFHKMPCHVELGGPGLESSSTSVFLCSLGPHRVGVGSKLFAKYLEEAEKMPTATKGVGSVPQPASSGRSTLGGRSYHWRRQSQEENHMDLTLKTSVCLTASHTLDFLHQPQGRTVLSGHGANVCETWSLSSDCWAAHAFLLGRTLFQSDVPQGGTIVRLLLFLNWPLELAIHPDPTCGFLASCCSPWAAGPIELRPGLLWGWGPPPGCHFSTHVRAKGHAAQRPGTRAPRWPGC